MKQMEFRKTSQGKHWNKKIAPIIVAICFIVYYTSGGIELSKLNLPNTIKIIALIVSVINTIVMILVLVERIKEINGGEEDDLSKY
jgi:hypothetical protein